MSDLSTDPPNSSSAPPTNKQAAWAQTEGSWHSLHGNFSEHGSSVEWHEFRIEHALNWGRNFHPGSLDICLNFIGSAAFWDGAADRVIAPNQIAVYTLQTERPCVVRRAKSLHRFLIVEISPDFLQMHFGSELEKVKPPIRSCIGSRTKTPLYLEINSLPASLLTSCVQFVDPPVPKPARRAWYLSRVLEILSETIFLSEEPERFFCKPRRTNRERSERVRYLIERNLADPPSLDMLAEEVGCSSFYLSRIFAQKTGTTIPKFLRMKRIEKAAELLRTGKLSVTQAALAVGYASLGAFGKAFMEQMGRCPSRYLRALMEDKKHL